MGRGQAGVAGRVSGESVTLSGWKRGTFYFLYFVTFDVSGLCGEPGESPSLWPVSM